MNKIIIRNLVAITTLLLVACGIEEKHIVTQDDLSDMSEEQLADAIAVYPKLTDAMLGGSLEYASIYLEENCVAYQELLTRKSGKDVLLKKVKELEKEIVDVETEVVVWVLKRAIRYEDIWQDELTEEDILYLE